MIAAGEWDEVRRVLDFLEIHEPPDNRAMWRRVVLHFLADGI